MSEKETRTFQLWKISQRLFNLCVFTFGKAEVEGKLTSYLFTGETWSSQSLSLFFLLLLVLTEELEGVWNTRHRTNVFTKCKISQFKKTITKDNTVWTNQIPCCYSMTTSQECHVFHFITQQQLLNRLWKRNVSLAFFPWGVGSFEKLFLGLQKEPMEMCIRNLLELSWTFLHQINSCRQKRHGFS